MSGVTNQEEDKKPTDQSAHINLKVKGQVSLSLYFSFLCVFFFFFLKLGIIAIYYGVLDLYVTFIIIIFLVYRVCHLWNLKRAFKKKKKI